MCTDTRRPWYSLNEHLARPCTRFFLGRHQVPSAALESGAQLMLLPSGPATVTEQLFSVPAMDVRARN